MMIAVHTRWVLSRRLATMMARTGPVRTRLSRNSSCPAAANLVVS